MKHLKFKILLLIFSQIFANINAQKRSIKITNVTCTALNVAYLKYTKCQLNKINKNDIAFSLYGKLMVKSLDNIVFQAKLFRKNNKKYSPFLYDDVIDFCEFQKKPKQNIFWNLIFQTMADYSNINHTCPYDHDFIINNLMFPEKNIKMLPFPIGNYKVQVLIITKGIKIGQFDGYFDM